MRYRAALYSEAAIIPLQLRRRSGSCAPNFRLLSGASFLQQLLQFPPFRLPARARAAAVRAGLSPQHMGNERIARRGHGDDNGNRVAAA